MKYVPTYLAIAFQLFVFGQDTVFFHVNPEKTYPYDEYSKNAMKTKIWYVNRVEIPYQKGIYNIPTNEHNEFDTIEIQSIVESDEYYALKSCRKAKRVTTIDTSSQIIISQLRNSHNYSLSQIFPGNFSIFSLDTFNIKQHFEVKISGFNKEDTLFLHYNYSRSIEIYGDTTIILNDPNKEMSNNLVARIELDNREFYPGCGELLDPNYTLLYKLNYAFLHGEKVIVNIDLERNEFKLETK